MNSMKLHHNEAFQVFTRAEPRFCKVVLNGASFSFTKHDFDERISNDLIVPDPAGAIQTTTWRIG